MLIGSWRGGAETNLFIAAPINIDHAFPMVLFVRQQTLPYNRQPIYSDNSHAIKARRENNVMHFVVRHNSNVLGMRATERLALIAIGTWPKRPRLGTNPGQLGTTGAGVPLARVLHYFRAKMFQHRFVRRLGVRERCPGFYFIPLLWRNCT